MLHNSPHPEFVSAVCFAYLGAALFDGSQAEQTKQEKTAVRPMFPVSARNSMFEGPVKNGSSGGFCENDFEPDLDTQ